MIGLASTSSLCRIHSGHVSHGRRPATTSPPQANGSGLVISSSWFADGHSRTPSLHHQSQIKNKSLDGARCRGQDCGQGEKAGELRPWTRWTYRGAGHGPSPVHRPVCGLPSSSVVDARDSSRASRARAARRYELSCNVSDDGSGNVSTVALPTPDETGTCVPDQVGPAATAN